MRCPHCKGERKSLAHINTGPDSSKHRWEMVNCSTCDGTGEITQEQADRIEYGQKLYANRLAARETLFEAASRQGMTPAQLSAIEHGRVPPLRGVKA